MLLQRVGKADQVGRDESQTCQVQVTRGGEEGQGQQQVRV